MLNKIKKGVLSPCPVCGGNNIDWYGYRYISLRCNDCEFEMYPLDEFASEDEYFKEWNSLQNIDTTINDFDKQIEAINKVIDKYRETQSHYRWTKERIEKARKELSSIK